MKLKISTFNQNLIIFLIIVCSFFLYSSRYYPLLSSDDALNILIAHYYDLPKDLYCWGQDRGGTFIPLISQIFIKFFGFSALWSVSLSNYLILIIGYIGFSSLIKSNYYKVLFAIAWFFPFERFDGLLRFPIGVQYSLLGISIFLINKIDFKEFKNSFKNHLIVVTIIVLFICAIWVSDLAIVSILLLLFFKIFFSDLRKKTITVSKQMIFYFIFGIIACFIFIWFAKGTATNKASEYFSLNSFSDLYQVKSILGAAWIKVLLFKQLEWFHGFYFYSLFLLLFAITYYFIKNRELRKIDFNNWIIYFLLEFIAVFFVLLLSSWVFANGMGRWYFVATYISLSVVVFLLLDRIEIFYPDRKLRIASLIIVLLGAASSIYSLKFMHPKSLKPMVNSVSEFEQLGEIGLIAEFWNSYLVSVVDPELIRATPNDKSEHLNLELVEKVFERKNLYVIRDMWMKSFPDTLNQFSYTLLKDGKEFRLGGSYVCKYNRLKLNRILGIDQLNHTDEFIVADNEKKKFIHVPRKIHGLERHIVWGPYTPLSMGNYTINYRIKIKDFAKDDLIAIIDVISNSGETTLATKKIYGTDIKTEDFQWISMNFNTNKRYENVEYRVYHFSNNSDITFDEILLKEN